MKNSKKYFVVGIIAAALVLASCGGEPVATEPQGETTVQTIPETTVKELTPVGSMLRHMSFNILGTEEFPGFDNDEKRNNIKSIIEEVDPDTFGVQEANQTWTDGLVEILDGKYAMAGGHSDPKVEYNTLNWINAIYYKADKFTYLDSGMHILNGDGGYVAGKPANNCPFVLLERKEDGALLLVLNVHLQWLPLGSDDLRVHNFEHYGIETADINLTRADQVVWAGKFATEKAAAYAAQYGKPVAIILSGDFNINSLHTTLYLQEYENATANLAHYGLTESALIAKELVSNQNTVRWVTYRRSKDPRRFDYIYIDSTLQPETFTVYVTDKPWEVTSDHMPVYLDYFITQ